VALAEELAEAMQQALREGHRERLRALRMLKAELQVAQTSGKDFKDSDVVKSYANKLRKSAEEYEQLALGERAAAMRADLGVVEEFLPPQMERSAIEELVTGLVREHDYGPRDIGKVMKAIMGEHGDVVDGRVVQVRSRAGGYNGTVVPRGPSEPAPFLRRRESHPWPDAEVRLSDGRDVPLCPGRCRERAQPARPGRRALRPAVPCGPVHVRGSPGGGGPGAGEPPQNP
jgi:uncharacterized protein YqeY